MTGTDHYSTFQGEHSPVAHPLVVVGNCQAESLRLLLDPDGACSVRVPPVFELDADGTARLHRLLARASVLVSQPIRNDYRRLDLGTDQLRRLLPDRAECVVVPIVRHLALHPFQVVHHSSEGTPPLPVVPYHDLRTVAGVVGALGAAARLTTAAVRAVAESSLSELRRREQATDVAVADLLAHPGPEHLRTVNHPGNPVLLGLASRVAERLDRPPVDDPGRPLLNAVRAPLEPEVADTWGFESQPGHRTWWVDGSPVEPEAVAAAHRRWYAERPEHTAVAEAVWQRHLPRARVLGLTADAPGDEGR